MHVRFPPTASCGRNQQSRYRWPPGDIAEGDGVPVVVTNTPCRAVWVKIRSSEAERAAWHAKARAVGLSLSDLVRRSVGRVRTWTVAHTELERERTRELARIGSNLNQIARWANTYREDADALEVVAHLVAIERAMATLAVDGEREP